MKKTYFDNLDALRFFSFLSVFFYHSFFTEFENIKNSGLYYFIKKDVFGNGNLGVNFFFVLSGFLITFLLIQEKMNSGKINIINFYIRRVLRIWPLYFFAVLFGFYLFPIIKGFFGEQSTETAHILSYLTFTSNFDFIKNGLPDASILGVLWSIAIEEQFYIAWPLILSILPIRKYWIAFLSILLASWIFRVYYDTYIYHEIHTLSCIGDMAIGGFGAWFILTQRGFLTKIENLTKPFILVIYFLALGIFLFRDELLYPNFYVRIIERSFIALIFLFIILEQNYALKSFFKLSRFKTITKLGIITYGLYILHFLGILISLKLTNYLKINTHLWQVLLIETLIALTITIVISKWSYRFFEKPFLNLKSKF